MLVALAGGVGAARLLRGLTAAVDGTEDVVAIVNTGDDVRLHGLHISPDLDTVVYTLAGAVNPETGWGLVGETWSAMDALDRYGGNTWFRLGDRDLATHLYRTGRLAEGAPLSTVTDEIRKAWSVEAGIVPMTDDRVETRVTVAGQGEIGFQDYFVRLRHDVPVSAVRFVGAESATPAPGVVRALGEGRGVVICPSNPVVSIGPILAVPGVRAAVEAQRDRCVAVSPIVAGAAIKGPADRMLRDLGEDASVVGVARRWAPLAATLIVDDADAGLAPAVEREGMRCVVAPTVMHGPAEAVALGRTVLDVLA